MIYPAQTLYFLFLAALKNYYVALLCSNFLPCQQQKLLWLNRNITLDLTLELMPRQEGMVIFSRRGKFPVTGISNWTLKGVI